MVPVQPANPPRTPSPVRKLLIIFGSIALGIALLIFLFVILILPRILPLSLTSSSAQSRLLTPADLGPGFQDSGDDYHLQGSTGAIFFPTTENCDIESALKSRLEEATSLAYTALANEDEYSNVYEEVFEFPDQASADQFIETARKGFDDSGCSSTSFTSDLMSWYISLNDKGTAQEIIGAGGSNSVAYTETSIYGSSSVATTYDGTKTFVASGKYVLYVSASYDVDESSWTQSDVTNLIKTAIHRELG